MVVAFDVLMTALQAKYCSYLRRVKQEHKAKLWCCRTAHKVRGGASVQNYCGGGQQTWVTTRVCTVLHSRAIAEGNGMSVQMSFLEQTSLYNVWTLEFEPMTNVTTTEICIHEWMFFTKILKGLGAPLQHIFLEIFLRQDHFTFE